MSEEAEIAKRDWNAAQIAEYARLENEIGIEKQKMYEDSHLKKLNKEQEKLNEMIELGEGSYLRFIEAAQQQQAGIKAEFVARWLTTEDKTFECPAGTATLRTTKSLDIRSKEKLVAFLELNKKLTDFIKTFEITKLRKIKDAGMLEDEICTWDEEKSVAIKITEAEQ